MADAVSDKTVGELGEPKKMQLRPAGLESLLDTVPGPYVSHSPVLNLPGNILCLKFKRYDCSWALKLAEFILCFPSTSPMF